MFPKRERLDDLRGSERVRRESRIRCTKPDSKRKTKLACDGTRKDSTFTTVLAKALHTRKVVPLKDQKR